MILAVVIPDPGFFRLISHHQHQRRMEVVGRAGVRLFHRLGALQNKNALRLVVVGGGGAAGSLQHQIQLFLLHGAVTELSQGIAGFFKLCKIHIGFLSFVSVPLYFVIVSRRLFPHNCKIPYNSAKVK
ncbi:hypothetical protein SDC9_162494 [bioreactor metagenome]|uniref:Uncharacterized protein n=1 Tax=bioreactor metagenome TaxID=1076179 RepID=A0A645FL92_9ZZZZ